MRGMIPERKPGRKNGLLDDPKKRGKLIRLLQRPDLTHEEIAKQMGYSRAWIEKACARLRAELGNEAA